MANTQEENQAAMLEFWEDLIDLAMRRNDIEALRNIPTDIYMLLGVDFRGFMGEPSEWEEYGMVLADGCSRADPHILGGDRGDYY